MKKEFYNIKDPAVVSKIMKDAKNDFGFLSQEAKEVFPDIVSLDSTNGMYSVNYVKLIPVLVEAIKEQQDVIEELTSRIESIENGSSNENKSALVYEGHEFDLDGGVAKLYQNTPNPFKAETTIRFEIPEEVGNAQIYICNMTGTLLKTIEVNQRSAGSVTINGNEFNAGMCLYSLVNDGKIIDTKQMLLTE